MSLALGNKICSVRATFITPDDENIKIWRYMDFTKLVSLIDTKKLYFTRADKFDDPFEGSYPKLNILGREAFFKDLNERKEVAGQGNTFKPPEIFKHMPKYTAVNCWHMNPYESVAMLSLYLKSDEGVAIQSTFSRLKESFLTKEDLYMGTVKYINYETEFVDPTNLYSPFVHKRKSFEHEKSKSIG